MAALDDLIALLGDRWRQLEDAGPPSELKMMATPVTRAGSPVRLGADVARHIYIPVSPDEAARFTEKRRGATMQIRCIADGLGDSDGAWIDIACLRPEAFDVFGLFAADILAHVDAEPAAAPAIIQHLYASWRRLFAAGGRPLSQSELVGLYAELRVLEQLLRVDAAAADRWVGPFSGTHDFVGPSGAAIEVKATTVPGHTIHVHGFAQLEPPPGGSLHLCHQHLEPGGPAGESISEIVERVLTLGDSHVISLALEALRYDRADEDAYRQTSFSVVSEAWYKVDRAFPRLKQESFRGGKTPSWLGDVTYELDLSAAVPFLADPLAVQSAQESVALP